MTKVLIVDDQQLLRRGLHLLLGLCKDVDVVAEACDGEDALRQLRAGLVVDVVLTDYQMPRMDGIALLSTLTAEFPQLPVIVLTTFDQDALVTTALDAGAAGFLLKDISPEKLGEAVCSVAGGDVVIDPRVARAALRRGTPPPAPDPLAKLTKTERSVAEQIGNGKSNKEIAAALFMAEGTVRNHVSAILRKLQLRDRTALALSVSRREGVS